MEQPREKIGGRSGPWKAEVAKGGSLFCTAGAVFSSFQVDLDMGDVKMHLVIFVSGLPLASFGLFWPPFGLPWALLGPPLGLPWGSLGLLWASLGLPWASLGLPLGSSWPPCASLGPCLGIL